MQKITHTSAEQTKKLLQKSIPQYSGKPIFLAVAGGSCVGKTSTILSYITDLLGENVSTVSIDNFQLGEDFSHKDQSQYRWDDPDNFSLKEIHLALDQLKKGKVAEIPRFNLDLNKRIGTQMIQPNKYILVEGLYAFYRELEPLADLKIYLETPYYGRLLRRIFRFTMEDNINKPAVPVRHMTGPTHKAHVDHVIKQKDTADISIVMPYTFEETYTKFNLGQINAPKLDTLDRVYFSSPEGVIIGKKSDEFIVNYKQQMLFKTVLDTQILETISDINFVEM